MKEKERTSEIAQLLHEEYPDRISDLKESEIKAVIQKLFTRFETEQGAFIGQLPAYEREGYRLHWLREQWGPSRFLMVSEILEEQFPDTAEALRSLGILKEEILNILPYVKDAFEELDFNPEAGSPLYNALTGLIAAYLEKGADGV